MQRQSFVFFPGSTGRESKWVSSTFCHSHPLATFHFTPATTKWIFFSSAVLALRCVVVPAARTKKYQHCLWSQLKNAKIFFKKLFAISPGIPHSRAAVCVGGSHSHFQHWKCLKLHFSLDAWVWVTVNVSGWARRVQRRPEAKDVFNF